MPPLECTNFLECENKTVCVAPFDLPHESNTSFFHHIPENYHISPCWAFLFFFFGTKFGQNGLECDSTWNYRCLMWTLATQPSSAINTNWAARVLLAHIFFWGKRNPEKSWNLIFCWPQGRTIVRASFGTNISAGCGWDQPRRTCKIRIATLAAVFASCTPRRRRSDRRIRSSPKTGVTSGTG